VLDIFNEANDSRDMKHKIDYREFYNDAINKEVNLNDHLQVWKSEREKPKEVKLKLIDIRDSHCAFIHGF
jgi:hypothetical protein